MAQNQRDGGGVILACPIYGCGGEIKLVRGEHESAVDCPTCQCPLWPLVLGYTGNDPDRVREFAKAQRFDGTLLQ
jgi:hypothetical protein